MPKRKNSDTTTAAAAGTQTFKSLDYLSTGVQAFLEQQKFTYMTPVQAAAIPQLLLHHKDVAVQAVTGSGKTLAFLIPVIEMLQKTPTRKKNKVGALILSPTRELAQQTHTVAVALCQACNQPPPLLLVGGGAANGNSSSTNSRPVTADLQAFQTMGSDILIGTCGRVQDVLTRYSVMDCSELECLILDEADVLLNMGFATSLQTILSKLPKMRRTGLFSATNSQESVGSAGLKQLMARAGMRNPVWINVKVTNGPEAQNDNDDDNTQATPTTLSNYYIVTKLEEKISRLAAFLQQHKDETVICFFLTCACVEFYGQTLQKLLSTSDVIIESLHGKMVQKKREKTMERFRGTDNGIALFCTDVAARGLDVTNVQWVVQFDAPQDPAFYVHRVGRAARAGRCGSSLLFVTQKEEPYIDLLRMRQIPLTPLPSSEICCPPESDDVSDNEGDGDKDNNVEWKDDGNTILSAAGPQHEIKDLLPEVKKLVLSDRDVLEKGTKAFTSYVRAYKEHQCSFIFRFVALDLGRLATSFCLLRLPKMPELKDALKKKGALANFTPAGPEVDIYAIPFKDKVREKARQKRLEQEIATGGKSAKLIKAEMRKAEREKRKQDVRKKAIEKGRNPDKKRGRNARIVDDWDELAKEERLYKKLKKKKITQAQYDALIDEV